MSEQLLNKILGKLENNDEIQNQILNEMQSMNTEIGGIKSDIVGIKSEIGGIKSDIANLDGKIATLDTKIVNLDAKVEKYAQAQQQDVYHLLELTNSKIDTLQTKMDAIPRIEIKLDIIEHRLFEQETDLRLIKQAK